MSPYRNNLPRIYLDPGNMYFSEKPTVVTTVLGSCVSVILFNRRTGTGAICHGLLPQCREDSKCDGHCMDHHRYVECSILRMFEQFREKGIATKEIEAKIFGGADMFGIMNGGANGLTVGRKNLEIAERIVAKERVKIISEDVGGTHGRKLVFHTHTGDVFLKRLKKQL